MVSWIRCAAEANSKAVDDGRAANSLECDGRVASWESGLRLDACDHLVDIGFLRRQLWSELAFDRTMAAERLTTPAPPQRGSRIMRIANCSTYRWSKRRKEVPRHDEHSNFVNTRDTVPD